jgi:hypothetical protein
MDCVLKDAVRGHKTTGDASSPPPSPPTRPAAIARLAALPPLPNPTWHFDAVIHDMLQFYSARGTLWW